MKAGVAILGALAVAMSLAPAVRAQDAQPQGTTETAEAREAELVRLLDGVNRPISPYESIGRIWPRIEALSEQMTLEQLEQAFAKLKYKKSVVNEQLMLKKYYTDGEKLIDAMQTAFENHDPAGVSSRWQDLQKLCDRMEKWNAKFKPSADDLRTRGAEIAKKAGIAAEIQATPATPTAAPGAGH